MSIEARRSDDRRTDHLPEAVAADLGVTARPVVPLRGAAELPTVDAPAAKYRELRDAEGDLPARLEIAIADAARKLDCLPQWERRRAAIYALLGDPE